MDIRSRKKDHVDAARKKPVEYGFGSGLEDVRLAHNSLPELDFEDIVTSCGFLGKRLDAPIIISGMTGGYPEAEKINLRLAEAAEEEKVAFGLGSQRAMLEKPQLSSTYKVRKVAPTIPIIGNIGACQLAKYGAKKAREMLDEIGADALAIHLNPLQEMVQPEGDKKFAGIIFQIEIFAKDLGLPVIVKETGAGISGFAASLLKKAGAKMVDVSGAGGTSWSKVEYLRSRQRPTFADWGNPTAICIAECCRILPVIASGGIRNGLDCAKAIALGASYAGAALPFIRSKDPAKEIAAWKSELRTAMLLCGSKDLAALSKARLFVTGKTAEEMRLAGINPSIYAER
ncbi:MAG: type 2 isopentenyl-diphosphate Delta-isomerase [Candidatus Micrarchaeota archaeon]|nr:type 2 isopentenyl-diphosphate Delta-isomerase [Candidatus Micrarchaeota archaeon]